MARTEEVLRVRMSAAAPQDQLAVIECARELQERILARRHGVLLPSSAEDLNQVRDERIASQ